MTKKEAISTIRAKNPHLSHISDDDLLAASLRQNPDLASKLSDYSAPKQEQKPVEQPKPEEKKKGLGRKVFDFFTGAEQKLGQTLGTAASVIDPVTKRNREAVLKQAQEQSTLYIKKAKETKNREMAKKYLEAAKRIADTNSLDVFNNPEYQKTAKQVFGEALGVGLDVVTAGALKPAGQAIKGGAVAGLAAKSATSAGKTALKAAGVGALTGGAYGVAGAMQDNAGLGDIAKQGATGAITGGLLAGGASRVSSKLANKSKYGAEQAGDTLANNLDEIFKNNRITIARKYESAASRQISLGRMLSESKIMPYMEKERLKFSPKDIEKVQREVARMGKTIDNAAGLYRTTVKADALKNKARKYIASNKMLVDEGRVEEMTKRAVAKIDNYTKQKGYDRFTVKEVNSFKKAMYRLSKKYAKDDVGKADAYSELGHVFMKVVEDEMPDVGVKSINQELGKKITLLNFMETVKDTGGIVVEGGRLGRTVDTLVGGGIGAFAGSSGGVFGSMMGAAAGKKASQTIRQTAQRNSILGPIDRILIKKLQQNPASQEMMAAKAFIEAVKRGEKPRPGITTVRVLANLMKESKINVRVNK